VGWNERLPARCSNYPHENLARLEHLERLAPPSIKHEKPNFEANDMAHNPSVKVARLYEATSQRGKTYLRGRLGLANIAIVQSNEVSNSGQPIWNVLMSEPETKSEYSKSEPAPKAKRPDHQAPLEHQGRTAYQRQHMNDEISI
jgi:hypothetical protein